MDKVTGSIDVRLIAVNIHHCIFLMNGNVSLCNLIASLTLEEKKGKTSELEHLLG